MLRYVYSALFGLLAGILFVRIVDVMVHPLYRRYRLLRMAKRLQTQDNPYYQEIGKIAERQAKGESARRLVEQMSPEVRQAYEEFVERTISDG